MPFSFPSRVSIGGVSIGREQGKHPTVIIPSMFYKGHKVVTNSKTGRFNHTEAETQINYLERIQEETGIPIILDLVGETKEALHRYTEWALNQTALPLAIDGISWEVRIPVAQWLCEIGAESRVLYNSISPSSPDREIKILSDLQFPSCVVLLAGPAMLAAEHRLKILENMLSRISSFPLKQILVDTMVIDRPSIGSAALACKLIKAEYNFPVGCAPGNTYREWEEFNIPKTSRSHAAMYASSVVLPVVNRSDFLFSGPTRTVKWVSRAVAVVDALMAQETRWSQKVRIDKSHPLFRIFRR